MHITKYRADEDALEYYRAGDVFVGEGILFDITMYSLRSSSDALIKEARDHWKEAARILSHRKAYELLLLGPLWYVARLSVMVGDFTIADRALKRAARIFDRRLVLSHPLMYRHLCVMGLRAHCNAWLGRIWTARCLFRRYTFYQALEPFSRGELEMCRNEVYEAMTINMLHNKQHSRWRNHRVRTHR